VESVELSIRADERCALPTTLEKAISPISDPIYDEATLTSATELNLDLILEHLTSQVDLFSSPKLDLSCLTVTTPL
jgi:hypothetical protein